MAVLPLRSSTKISAWRVVEHIAIRAATQTRCYIGVRQRVLDKETMINAAKAVSTFSRIDPTTA